MEKEIIGCMQCAEVVWKLECTEKEVEDLKRQRREDGKANAKVASIYATQEQTWFGERDRLRLQIAALLNQLGIFEKRRAECVESLTGKINDLEDLLASNKQMLEEELEKSKELEENLKDLEMSVAAQREEHAAEVSKNKTAFVQLVSSHGQLEAELCRAFRQVEVGKVELRLILEQKNEAVSMAQKLSLEVVKLHNDAQQKDETRRQKHSITSMWYKHRNPRIKLWQTEAKTSAQENADDKNYRNNLEQRHSMELDSLAEQLRLRDEQIEILHWRLLSTEIKSEQLRAHTEELKKDKGQITQVNLKLEEQLLDCEADLHYLKNILASSRPSSKSSITERKPADYYKNMKAEMATELDNETDQDGVWKDVKEITSEQRMHKKMDVQALGVFHKVKRLKQQLIMLERFTSQLKSVEGTDDRKALTSLMSLLNKQVCRYESLQSRIDELCNRMSEDSNQHRRPAQPNLKRKTKEEIKALEKHLQEALHLQRYMVAAGQKLSEILNGITSTLCVIVTDEVDMSRFACSMRDVFKEVQKGLEIQSSRIIGYLEGTLACDGMESYT